MLESKGSKVHCTCYIIQYTQAVSVGLVVAMGDPVVAISDPVAAIISVVAVGITLKELDETTGGTTPSV